MSGTTGIASWRDVVKFIKGQLPDVFVTGKFSFLTIHYLYIMGMAILLSVITFGIGDIAYIDALFFTSGACTQSGLNTVNVNDIYTGQQVVLYLGAMFCNPIVIHSSVVFVRLYWFEKKFEDVVREARNLRRTRSKGRTNTFNKDDIEKGEQETGFRNRATEMLKQTGRRMSNRSLPPKNDNSLHNGDGLYSTMSRRESEPGFNRSRRTSRADSMDGVRLPQAVSTEQHIRFLENQRNPKDDVVLYIPSPREYDRGGKPENIVESEDDEGTPEQPGHGNQQQDDGEPHRTTIRTHLTFNEPEIIRDRPRTGNIPPRLNQKRFPTGDSTINGLTQAKRTYTGNTLKRSATGKTAESMPYLSYEATVGRNSFFVNLTEEQREELGGIEYRALKTLALVLIGYFFFWHLFGILCLTPWIYKTSYGNVVTEDGQGRAWWGVFTAASAFNDLGFTLTPDSMISFQSATFPLLVMTFLVIIGNTGFPCMLRFTIWFISQFTRTGSGLWEELQFLLDHPRRCFTLLFPRAATWWLFTILVILNGLDLLFFVVLDLNNSAVEDLSGWEKFLDGLFQAASTRTAGFAVVNLAALHPAIQVSYLIMMYISAFPIAISMRRTNVYEERSLGIYASVNEDDDEENGDKEPSYVGAHIRKQLSFDLWYIFLGLFIIAICEGGQIQNNSEYAFTTFSCLFEIVSAYGTVGLSLGYPTNDASFSAEFGVISKLVIIAMQIRGRHRGLPYGLDRAVLLPSDSLHQRDQKEAERMVRRRPSLAMSMTSAVDGQMESEKFRPETGLSSGFDADDAPQRIRDRRFMNINRSNSNVFAEQKSPTGPARRELGNAMFKLATAPNQIKEEIANRSSSSDS